MTIPDEAFHGSDLEKIAAHYHIDVNSIVPCASNVNPLGISPVARQTFIDNIDVIKAYPDREYTQLKDALANYTGANKEHLVLGNGTSELIHLLFKVLSPHKTLIIGPTYSEYRRSAQKMGSKVEMYQLTEDTDFELDVDSFLQALQPVHDLLIICNPNNPTGKAIPVDALERILERCQALNIMVAVDETYVEFVEDINMISCISLTKAYQNLVVLRGISKFFSAPGLRFGYATTSNDAFLNAAGNDKIPWNINAYVAIAGVMFEDTHYINLTRSLIQTERNLICSALSCRKTIKIFRPDANFILIKLLKEGQTAKEVFDYCIQKGFMIRDCSDYEGLGEKYIRFCFMKPEQNDQLVNTLLEIV